MSGQCQLVTCGVTSICGAEVSSTERRRSGCCRFESINRHHSNQYDLFFVFFNKDRRTNWVTASKSRKSKYVCVLSDCFWFLFSLLSFSEVFAPLNLFFFFHIQSLDGCRDSTVCYDAGPLKPRPHVQGCF